MTRQCTTCQRDTRVTCLWDGLPLTRACVQVHQEQVSQCLDMARRLCDMDQNLARPRCTLDSNIVDVGDLAYGASVSRSVTLTNIGEVSAPPHTPSLPPPVPAIITLIAATASLLAAAASDRDWQPSTGRCLALGL